MSLELAHQFSFWAALKPPVDCAAGPLGHRVYFEVTEGGPPVNAPTPPRSAEAVTVLSALNRLS